jgi:DNA (cytosine-5)-methyltransferase 1
METSKPSTGETLFDLTLYAADTPANPSAPQASAKARMTHATYGLGLGTPLANYDPDTQSWKMYGDTYLWGDSPLLENLPPSGMTQNGELYLQHPWEPITNETESSLWPTPTAVTRPMEGNVRMYRAKIEAGQMTEAEAEAILGKSVWEAQGAIPMMWPTPVASDWKPRGPNSKHQGLWEVIKTRDKLWPTPTARDWKGAAGFKKEARNMADLTYLAQVRSGTRNGRDGHGGSLNPTWVEWLMGFPTGWTDLED